MGKFDLGDVTGSIRALLGASPSPRVAAELDPAALRYLESLGIDANAWKSRFGFDPDVVYPATPQVARAARALDGGAPAPADLGIEAPLFPQMSKAQDAYDNLRRGRTANLRNSGGDLARIAGDNIRTADDAARASRKSAQARDAAYMTAGALGAAGLGLGIGQMAAPGTSPALTESGNPADLREESASDILSRPELPMVPQEDIRIPKKTFYEMDGRPFDEGVRGGRPESELMEPVAQPADYSMQAREMINKLNAMRRAAGGEVPEAPAMMREINRLMELGNRQRNTPSYQIPASDPARDPYQQAKNLIAQVNNMYRAGYTQNSPEVQRVMAEVRRLHAEGDAIRNRRAG